MQTSYTVTIRKEHCEGRSYMSNDNCPLCAAIREQLPGFPLRSVGGDYVRDTSSGEWKIDNCLYPYGWESIMVHRILSGEVKEHKVTFSIDKPETTPVPIKSEFIPVTFKEILIPEHSIN